MPLTLIRRAARHLLPEGGLLFDGLGKSNAGDAALMSAGPLLCIQLAAGAWAFSVGRRWPVRAG
jgi:hypothetical protein